MKRIFSILFIGSLFLLYQNSFSQSLSYKPGSGIHFQSEQEDEWLLRLLGYIQSTYTYHNENSSAVQNEFFVRRARLDFIFDYLDTYQIFFELDARGKRTEMVLAQLDVKYLDNHKIRIGKYITPFSPENTRSSRGLSSVERYSALNSLFLLPALDTQYGIMFMGTFGKVDYYFSVSNGNGKASDNIKENNEAKDFQIRLDYHSGKKITFGTSANYSIEETQELSLVDHTFESFNTVNISGDRLGYLGFFEYDDNPYLIRTEAFQYHFTDSLSNKNQVQSFSGGMLELGYFITGNKSDGIQLIGRYEISQLSEVTDSFTGPKSLHSFIIGTNWYMDNIFRLQVNLVYERANKKSLVQNRFFNKESEFEILTMLQLKF